jgi:hypothetical protein
MFVLWPHNAFVALLEQCLVVEVVMSITVRTKFEISLSSSSQPWNINLFVLG